MVHRKSTYKLAFKNLSKDLRKNIFEENSILREKRRIKELSHHSLDEIDDSCECDLTESDDDDNDDKGISNASDEESDDSGRQTDTDLDSSAVDHVDEKSKNKGDVFLDRRKSKSSKEAKKKFSSTLVEEKPRKCAKKVPERIHRRKAKSEHIHLKSPRSDDLDKNRFFESRDFGSEANLVNFLQTLRNEEKRRGVLKGSKATGEYDLIPARLKSVPKETKKKLQSPPLCRRLSSSDRNILNVRPRTALVSMPIRSSSATKKQEVPPKERVIFSDDDIITEGTAHKLELRSSRREPRMKSYSTDHFSTEATLCHRCAQPIKQRGILT